MVGIVAAEHVILEAPPESPDTAPAASTPARADEVRAARPDDLPAIASLFHSVFRHTVGQPSPDLIAHLKDIYFEHPWQDPATPSLVFVSANGSLDGFIGVLPLRLRFQGQSIRGAIAGALMVREPQERPLAGARLLRTFLSGPQDLSLGDTANWSSQTPWERLGGTMLPAESMEWLKILRLARFGANSLSTRLPRFMGPLLRPLGRVVDGMIRLVRRKAEPARKDGSDETVDDNAYLSALAQITAKRDLSLNMGAEDGHWLLAQAAAKRSLGTLHRRVVSDRRGRPIGCYLMYTRGGEAAETLMVAAEPKQADAVVASMIDFAAAQGCAALKGRTQPVLMNSLFKAGCILRHRCSTVVHTANPALLEALERGRVSLGGFYGETWTRLVSDDFGQIRNTA